MRWGSWGSTLLPSVGPDLPWLTGYEATPLERLDHARAVPGGGPTVVPRLEVLRGRPGLSSSRFGRGRRPRTYLEIVAGLAGAPGTVAGDRTWSRFLLDLQARLPVRPGGRPARSRACPRQEGRVGGGCALVLASAAVDRIGSAACRRGCGPRRADRARRRRRRCCPDPGGGSPTRELRDRGVGSQCRKPPPRPQRPGDRAGRSSCSTSGARWTAIAPTSPGACTQR